MKNMMTKAKYNVLNTFAKYVLMIRYNDLYAVLINFW